MSSFFFFFLKLPFKLYEWKCNYGNEHIGCYILLSALRYVKTTANATVDHLSKYLALRIALEDSQSETQVNRNVEEEPGAVGNSSLQDVSEKQFTIYISTTGGQFSVSHAAISTLLTEKSVRLVLSLLFLSFRH